MTADTRGSHLLKSVTFVALHAYPDPEVGAKRVSELANWLVERGWSVTMIARAGPFPVEGGHLSPSVRRLSLPVPRTFYSRLKPLVPRMLRRSKGGHRDQSAITTTAGPGRVQPVEALRRAFLDFTLTLDPFKRWSWRAFVCALGETRRNRPSLLVCSAPPWSPMVAATAVGQLRRVPIVLDFRDPWHFETVSYPWIWRWTNRWLEHWCVTRSALVTCSTDSIAEMLRRRYPESSAKVHCIRNGYDPDDELPSPAPHGALRILYAGTIYLGRSPMPLLQGLRLLLDDPGVDPSLVQLTMVGHCSQWNGVDLREWIEQHRLNDNVTISAPVSRDSVRQLTIASNVLANFSQGQKDMIPAKLFEQIAARRTVLLFAEEESEAARCAQAVSSVIRVDDEPIQVRDTLRTLYYRYVSSADTGADSRPDIAAFSRRHSNEAFMEAICRVLTSDGESSVKSADRRDVSA